jgi:hypothetical protein
LLPAVYTYYHSEDRDRKQKEWEAKGIPKGLSIIPRLSELLLKK